MPEKRSQFKLREVLSQAKQRTKEAYKLIVSKVKRIPYIAALSYSLSFVLLVFRNNIFDIPVGEVLTPLLVSVLLVDISYRIFIFVIKDRPTAGIMTFLLAVFMVQFEFIFVKTAGFLKTVFPVRSSYDVAIVVILAVGTFIALNLIGITLKKHSKFMQGTKKFLDISLGVYFLVTIGSVLFLIAVNHRIFSFKLSTQTPVLSKESQEPDIYYFVFDRYANEETLNKYYDFSNEDFVKQMESKGFVFNDITYSNYPYTATSLSSTLNQDYLDEYLNKLPPKYSETVYNEMIDSSSGINTLRDNGYTYHHVGSWWGATRTSELADESYVKPFQINFLGLKFVVSDFQDELLRSHIIRRVIAADIPGLRKLVHYEQPTQRQIVNYQLGSVKEIVDASRQTNVAAFFHILSPHPQYVFDEDGSVPPYHKDANYGDISEKIKYVNQLKYINSQTLDTMDYILENSDKPPIIIFQPDEGPYRYKDIDDSTVSRAEKMQWKYGVTSAFYLPGYEQDNIELSPVNIFPHIFNNYFGTDIELQENSNYWYNKNDPYNFQNITELITE